jgi:hypothetical protein
MSKIARPTTPDEEGIELHPDAWERFERTVKKVAQARPAHRTGKKAAADRAPTRRGGAKSTD